MCSSDLLLTKNSAKSAHNKSFYTSEKITEQLDFEFEPINDVIARVSKEFKK